MGRLTASLLLAGCISLQMWGQTPAATPNQTSQQPPDKPAASAGEATASQPASGPFILDRFPEFSAIMTGSVIPNHDERGHVYRSHNLMRMQGNAAVPNYFITDLTKSVSHAMATSGCLRLSSPYSRAFPFILSGPDLKFEATPAGEETVNGHSCKIEDIAITIPKHPRIDLRFYEAQDLQGFPIKIENHHKGGTPWVIEYTDVTIGPQDPTLFIVPEKCQDEHSIMDAGKTTKKKPAAPAAKPQ